MSDHLKDLELSRQNIALTAAQAFEIFVQTVAALRHPVTGCPWDLKQNHQTLRRFMLEEAYEASDAMLGDDADHLLEELGDVLLQVVLNAQVASDLGRGDVRDVIECINAKMVRRHPHVFNVENTPVPSGVEEHKQRWEAIKAEEKRQGGQTDGIFDDCKKIFPSLTQAYKIGKRAEQIGFDWANIDEVWKHLKSELAELEVELSNGDTEGVRKEFGDVFFTLVQVARHLGLDPETVAQEGNVKFLRRFENVESVLQQQGEIVSKVSRGRLEELWIKVKLEE